MSSPRAAFAARLASLPLALAVLGAASPAGATECFEAISQENTQKLFDALNKVRTGEGCALESVGTEQAKMSIVWKKGDRLLEPILVLPTSCVKTPSARGKVLSAVVPPAVAQACPTAVSETAALLASDTFGGLVPVPAGAQVPDAAGQPVSLHRTPRPAVLIAGGLAAALLVAAGVVGLRRRKAKQGGAASPAETSKPPAEGAPSEGDPAAKPAEVSGSPESEPAAKPVEPTASPEEDPDTSGPPTA